MIPSCISWNSLCFWLKLLEIQMCLAESSKYAKPDFHPIFFLLRNSIFFVRGTMKFQVHKREFIEMYTQKRWVAPLKFDIYIPKKCYVRKEIHFPNHHFWYLCRISGCWLFWGSIHLGLVLPLFLTLADFWQPISGIGCDMPGQCSTNCRVSIVKNASSKFPKWWFNGNLPYTIKWNITLNNRLLFGFISKITNNCKSWWFQYTSALTSTTILYSNWKLTAHIIHLRT